MLTGEIVAARPSATQVEWATRRSRERTFLPALSEVLKVLDAAAKLSGAFDEDDGAPMILWAHRDLANAVADAEGGASAATGAGGHAMSAATLARKAFSTSRLAEFASVPELARQTGQPPQNWPLTIVKELVDNAIDAAEEADVAPVVEVESMGRSLSRIKAPVSRRRSSPASSITPGAPRAGACM